MKKKRVVKMEETIVKIKMTLTRIVLTTMMNSRVRSASRCIAQQMKKKICNSTS